MTTQRKRLSDLGKRVDQLSESELKRLVTMDGRKVRVLCTDRVTWIDKPVVATYRCTTEGREHEIVTFYSDVGLSESNYCPIDLALEIRTKTVTKWVNVYRSQLGGFYLSDMHNTPEVLLRDANMDHYVAITLITFEVPEEE